MTWRYVDEDQVELHGGVILKTHGPLTCDGQPCPIHNQSTHHMVTWPLNWRWDRQIMERICSHGIGHPDPDDYRIRNGLDVAVHGCDGCCRASSILKED